MGAFKQCCLGAVERERGEGEPNAPQILEAAVVFWQVLSHEVQSWPHWACVELENHVGPQSSQRTQRHPNLMAEHSTGFSLLPDHH